MGMTLRAVGIGDLHLDGKLSKHIPNLNQVIVDEIELVLTYAQKNGIKYAFYYGDICDIPNISSDAVCKLLDLFSKWSNIKHILITGNHDHESEEKHSLLILQKLVEIGRLTNVKIISKPTTLFRSSGTPVKFLPWPHFSVEEDCLNVIHVETNGSKWEIGKPIESDRDTDYVCVGGHLHTNQRVKNTYFSGTLYQTNFGEKADKFFHDIQWDGSKAKIVSVPHVPKYTLINQVITTVGDLSKIDHDPYHLYKVFVKAGAQLTAQTFDSYPNVIKINQFQTRKDLELLIAEELVISDATEIVNSLSVFEALKTYLERFGGGDSAIAARAEQILSEIYT